MSAKFFVAIVSSATCSEAEASQFTLGSISRLGRVVTSVSPTPCCTS